MESLTWIAVAMAGLNLVDSIVTKILNFLAKSREEANRLQLAMQQTQIAVQSAKVEVKTNQNASDIATARMETKECQDSHKECRDELANVKAQLDASKVLHESQESRITSVERSVVKVAAALPATQLDDQPKKP